MTASLPDAEWRHRAGLDGLLDALGAADGDARYVGGAVRDTLIGLPVSDVDVATVHDPQTVIERLERAGIKAVPTGIDHGTITAVTAGSPVEVTTLRRDVSTDGRRATVAFTDDWREDAARRDFTINALYADPATGEVSDYFGGIEDLRAGRVRFIGDASARITEDHLRILRYFRFLARFGRGEPDSEAYGACRAAASQLMGLSRERIADELLKLLAVEEPVPALRLMVEGDILRAILPEVGAAGVDHVASLQSRERDAGIAPSPVRRLAALLPRDPAIADAVGARLKLSRRMRARLTAALAPAVDVDARALAYHFGMESAVDRLLLDSGDLQRIGALVGWQSPDLPIGGGALIGRGLAPGPAVAKALKAVEQQWVDEGFPDAARVGVIADQIVSKFQRARQ
ncbi:MAG: CCA tRNA nucleotidyltransferase [Sphingobium sp.]